MIRNHNRNHLGYINDWKMRGYLYTLIFCVIIVIILYIIFTNFQNTQISLRPRPGYMDAYPSFYNICNSFDYERPEWTHSESGYNDTEDCNFLYKSLLKG